GDRARRETATSAAQLSSSKPPNRTPAPIPHHAGSRLNRATTATLQLSWGFMRGITDRKWRLLPGTLATQQETNRLYCPDPPRSWTSPRFQHRQQQHYSAYDQGEALPPALSYPSTLLQLHSTGKAPKRQD